MITLNLLDDMRVYLLFNRLRCDAQRVFDGKWRARAVRDDADAIDAEKRAATVFLIVGFIFNSAKRFSRQKRAQPFASAFATVRALATEKLPPRSIRRFSKSRFRQIRRTPPPPPDPRKMPSLDVADKIQ